jgi:hypothetical protein
MLSTLPRLLFIVTLCPLDTSNFKASFGFISTQASGAKSFSIEIVFVFVLVCHCSTVLPVFKFNGNFLLQDSDNGSQ